MVWDTLYNEVLKQYLLEGKGGGGENIDNYSLQHEYKALAVKQPLPRPCGMERRRYAARA